MKLSGMFLTLICCLICLASLDEKAWADEKQKEKIIELLPAILSLSDNETGTCYFFTDQNRGNAELIRDIISTYDLTRTLIVGQNNGQSVEALTAGKTSVPLAFEFKRINPTKYRVRIHHARGSFPLIFNESFHPGWKAYIVSGNRRRAIDEGIVNKYKILEGGDEDQAGAGELREFIAKGLVTYLGDGLQKKRMHYAYLANGQKRLDHIENYAVDFISKDVHGTIKNDNLPSGQLTETLAPGKLVMKSAATHKEKQNSASTAPHTLSPERWSIDGGLNKTAVILPDILHWQVNGYANSWWIDLNLLRLLPEDRDEARGFYTVNADGTLDFEFVIEFWYQRLFYMGLLVSGTTLLFSIAYLVSAKFRRKRLSVMEQ